MESERLYEGTEAGMGYVGAEDGWKLSICTRKMGPGMDDVMARDQS